MYNNDRFFPLSAHRNGQRYRLWFLQEKILSGQVRIKRHPTKGDEFYNMDQWKWYSDGMPAKDYEDPVQIQFRILLNRAMVNTFALFEYTYDEVIKKYFP